MYKTIARTTLIGVVEFGRLRKPTEPEPALPRLSARTESTDVILLSSFSDNPPRPGRPEHPGGPHQGLQGLRLRHVSQR